MGTVVLAGGSGLLGTKLRARLERQGTRVLTLTRRPRPGVATDVRWQPGTDRMEWAPAIGEVDAVVNLAGENLAGKRWTAARKQAILASRVAATRSLVQAIKQSEKPPRVFVSGSAVGYYGAHGDEPVSEDTPPGDDALAEVCVAWEREASALADEPRTRMVIVRTGQVMTLDGAALKELRLPFSLGLGAVLGSGRQYFPWIHVDDWIEMVVWLIANLAARGAFNLTAPTPVTNREFTRTLARVMRRPAIFTVPGFALKIILGELAEFVLTGQRVLPTRAEQLGYQFRFRELEPALRNLLIP